VKNKSPKEKKSGLTEGSRPNGSSSQRVIFPSYPPRKRVRPPLTEDWIEGRATYGGRNKRALSKLSALVLIIWCVAQLPAFISAADPQLDPAPLPSIEIAQNDLAGAVEPPSLVNPPPLAGNPQPPRDNPQPGSATPAAIPPSQNVTINLINRLVQRGVLTQEDATELIRMAERDAEVARAHAAAAHQTAAAAEVRASAAQAAVAQLAVAPSPPAEGPADDEVRVTYVPEIVKQQLRDEIRQEVMSQAREENWAAPRTFPEWTSRFKLFGDVRVRSEGDYFPSGNDNTGAFPNFNAINTGPPYDVRGEQFAPQLNVDQDRNRFRLRVRFGVAVDLTEGFTAGLRIATGENNSPVTTNQSLGLANQGQGGNFSKYAIWLDRGFLKYQVGGELGNNFSASVGRFDNPFFGTEIIWDDDLGFDGLALQGKYEVAKGVTPFANVGAFPVFNTDFNFSSNRPDKFESDDKYLFGGQVGVDWKIHKEWSIKLAGAYYHFDNVEGRLSSPFTPLTAQDAGDTDNTRPSFAQKGNTYFPIRDIVPTDANNFGKARQFQYFGLATPFENFAATGRLDFNHFDPVHISLIGEFVHNLAFDHGEIERRAVNNRGPDIPPPDSAPPNSPSTPGDYEGGDTAWIVGLRVGHAALEKRWDWNAGVAYRYVESDAVIDGFNDSDFGLGGTNLKGFTISASVAIASHVSLSLRWLSADSIAGPTYKNDIIQFDVNAKF